MFSPLEITRYFYDKIQNSIKYVEIKNQFVHTCAHVFTAYVAVVVPLLTDGTCSTNTRKQRENHFSCCSTNQFLTFINWIASSQQGVLLDNKKTNRVDFEAIKVGIYCALISWSCNKKKENTYICI